MFNISFWELSLVALIALLVLGPERLPAALRGVARTVKTLRATLNHTKAELERQLEIDALRSELGEVEARRQQLVQTLTPEVQGYLRQLHAEPPPPATPPHPTGETP